MIFKKQTLVEQFPAWNIYEREADIEGFVNITVEDVCLLPKQTRYHGIVHKEFSPGSCVSYALQYNKDPIEAYNRAVSMGHNTHWFNPCGSVITSHKRPAVDAVLIRIGMRIRFEGRLFQIAPDFNDNIKLVPIEN